MKSKIKGIISIISILALVYLVFHLLGIGCPIKWLTGISCAGCGMTRAWMSLIKLDFDKAFYYHPLFFLPPIALVIYVFKEKIPIKFYKAICLTFVVLFVIIYVIRLVLSDGSIVVFEPKNGAVLKLVLHLLR